MKFKNILKRKESKEIQSVKKAITLMNTYGVSSHGRILGNIADNVSESKLLQDYKTSLYLFRGTELIVEVATSQEINMFKILNADGDAEKVVDHEFLDIFNSPNNLQNRKQFERIMYINILYSGETFIRLIKDDSGKLIAYYNVRPDLVEVELKEHEGEERVIYTIHLPNGEMKTYTSDDVMHIYKPDPTDPMRGAGVLRSLYSRVSAEKKASELQNKTFERGGRSEGVLYVAGLNGDQKLAETIKRKVNKSFTSGEPISVLGSEAKYQQLSLTPRELDFIESMKFMRDEILLGLGIPKELLTMEDGGALTNGGDRGMKLFLKFTIEPMVLLYTEAFTEDVLNVFYDEAFLLKPENIVPEDRKAIVEEARGLKKDGIISVNQARDMLGLDPEEGHDEIKETVAPFRIENAFKGRHYLAKKIHRKEKFEKKKMEIVEKVVNAKMKEFLTLPTAKFQKVYHKAMNSVTDININQMLRETRKLFREQKARMEKAMTETDEPITPKMFDLEEEAKITKRLGMQVFPDIAIRSGNAGLIPVKSFHEKVNDFTMDAELIRMIEERAFFFATNVTGVTYAELSKIIFNGLEEGLSRDQLTNKILDFFDGMSKARAKRIAQTEGIHMSNVGLQHSYDQEPLVTAKQWITAKDGRVRDEHVLNDGVVVSKHAVFPNGESFPAERTINCRCVIAPVVQ